jgi:hypothetical protein
MNKIFLFFFSHCDWGVCGAIKIYDGVEERVELSTKQFPLTSVAAQKKLIFFKSASEEEKWENLMCIKFLFNNCSGE